MHTKIFVVALMLFVPWVLTAATTISNNGISITLSETLTEGVDYGKYANGDYWIVGQQTLTSYTPSMQTVGGRAMNGYMINPRVGKHQSYDSGMKGHTGEYYSAPDPLPKVIPVDSTLIIATSSTASGCCGGDYPWIHVYVPFTFVNSAPAPNSFRPCAWGDGPKVSSYTTADLNYDALADLSPINLSGVPSWSAVEKVGQSLIYNGDGTWEGRTMRSVHGMGGEFTGASAHIKTYGRDIANAVNAASLMLNTQATDETKRLTLIQIVQYGIDDYGITQLGGRFVSDGGHGVGHMAAIAVAAMVLDDAGMKARLAPLNGGTEYFAELGHTFYVSQTDVDQKRYTADGRPRTPYMPEDIGKPEWGMTHDRNRDKDGDNWDAYYRDVAGGTMVGLAALLKVMGADEFTGENDAFFAYVDRHWSYRQGVLDDRWDGNIPYGLVSDGSGSRTGNTKSAPFGYNETPAFESSFYGRYVYSKDTTQYVADTTRVASIEFTPKGQSFIGPQLVSLQTGTANASIYFTLDGTPPDSLSARYSGPILISENTVLSAIGMKDGYTSSQTTVEEYDFGPWQYSEGWHNVSFGERTENFTFWFQASVSSTKSDAVIALGNELSDGYTDNAVLVRFNPAGQIDVRNGNVYAFDNILNYEAGHNYAFQVDVNVTARTYSVTVIDQAGMVTDLASSYAFRTDQAGLSAFSNFSFVMDAPTAGPVLEVTYAGFEKPGNVASRPSTPSAPFVVSPN